MDTDGHAEANRRLASSLSAHLEVVCTFDHVAPEHTQSDGWYEQLHPMQVVSL